MSCWSTLGIAPTNDINEIRAAYRARLPGVHPEDDPEGFQNLRKAYEQALQQAREAPVEMAETTGQEPDVETRQETSAVERMLDELLQLLNDPRRRFILSAWRDYCRQLDTLPLEDLENLELPLFNIISNTGNLSIPCMRLLAERMDWAGRQMQMPRQRAEQVDELLRRLEGEDPFDLSLMQEWSLSAQLETLWYYRSAQGLFRYTSLSECRQFLEAHTVVPLPDCAEAISHLQNIATLAGLPLPSAYQRYRQRWQEAPRDLDNLYLLAHQSSLLGEEAEAFGYWRTLWLNNQQPQAAEWLLQWCHRHHPDWLPLLIQAFDLPSQPLYASPDPDSPLPLEEAPAQSAATVMRWYQAAQYELSDLARAFIDWRLNGNEQGFLQHLLADDGSDPRLGWYRKAWLLWRGDSVDLENLIQHKQGLGILDRLLLDGFQRQAGIQLQWLHQSSAIQTLRTWLQTREGPLPEQLFAEKTAMDQLLTCLGRLRHYSDSQLHTLSGLLNLPDLAISQLPAFIRQQINLHQHTIALPELPNEPELRWKMQRQTLLLVSLLEQPEAFLDAVSLTTLRGLDEDGAHPFQRLSRHLQSPQKPSELLSQLDDEDPLAALIRSRLKPTPQDLLLQPRLPTLEALFTAGLDIAPFNDGSLNALLLYGALYLCQGLTDEQRQAARQELLRYDYEEPLFSQLRDHIVNLQLSKLSRQDRNKLGLNKEPYYILWESFEKLVEGKPPTLTHLPRIQRIKDDTSLALAIRLTATLLLSYSEPFILHNQNSQDTPAWAFWRLGSRLNRKAFLLQSVFLGYAASLILPEFGPWSLVLVFACWFTCALRRIHDTGQGLGFLIVLLLMGLLFPLTILALLILLQEGDPVANQYGAPPGGNYPGMEQGLQAALRLLDGKNP